MAPDSSKIRLADQRRHTQVFLTPHGEIDSMSSEEIKRLVHELDTYQIELKLQNKDLRQAQEQLEHSRLKYLDLYNFAPVGYLTISEKGLIEEANFTAAKMFGVERNNLLSQPFSQFIAREDQGIHYHCRKKLLETQEVQSYGLRMRKKDGSLFYAQLKSVANSAMDGDSGQFRITLIDISQQQHTEEMLRVSEKGYRTLVENVDLGITMIANNYTILMTNAATGKLFAKAVRGLVGKKCYREFKKEEQSCADCPGDQAMATGEGQEVEFEGDKGDGCKFPVRAMAFPVIGNAGETVGFTMVLEDISSQTTLKQNLQHITERYQSIVMDQYDLICRFDPQGRITFVNDAYCDCFSVKSIDILGTNFLPNIHRDDLTLVENQFKNLSPQYPKKTVAHRVIVADGTIRWQQWSGRALFNEQGEVLEYQAVGRDITELKETEAALREAGSQLEQRVHERTMELALAHQQLLHSEKLSAVGALSASIAHEFNNPMQGILTVLSGIARRAPLAEEDMALAHSAIKECKRIKKMVRDLQDFNRPTLGKRVPMNLRSSIDSLLLLCKSNFKQRKILVVTDYADNTPMVMAVPDQIKQVFLNLLSNAADACPEGGTIQLSVRPRENRVQVEVSDNGVGIKPEDLGRIFEPFFTTKSEAKGNGLGLSVSYGLIKEHSGSLEVESEPGAGTTFSISLPVGGGSDGA